MWEATHYIVESREHCIVLDCYKAPEKIGRKLTEWEFLIQLKDGSCKAMEFEKIGVL